jgi:hypothetical protein
MSEAKHTPGPWANVDGDIYDVTDDGNFGIPLLRTERGNYRSWGRSLTDEEREANAALIAAAPAMFEALKYIEAATAELHGLAHITGTARAALSQAQPQPSDEVARMTGNVLSAERGESELSRDKLKDGVSDTAAKAEE